MPRSNDVYINSKNVLVRLFYFDILHATLELAIILFIQLDEFKLEETFFSKTCGKKCFFLFFLNIKKTELGFFAIFSI